VVAAFPGLLLLRWLRGTIDGLSKTAPKEETHP